MAIKGKSGTGKRSTRNSSESAKAGGSPAARGGTSAKGTVSGPSAKGRLSPRRGLIERTATAFGGGTSSESETVRRMAVTERLQAKADATEAIAGAMPVNETKPTEYALEDALFTPEGEHRVPENADVGASTISESNENDKNGSGAGPGTNPNIGPLTKHRVDSGGRALTTNQGVPIADNQNSLRVGTRGPTLIEDFILREKITHFDHERIPERVVHARGSGAHGVFECTEALTDITRAVPFAAVGKRTPVFVRFSTVAGERGSADTVRDVRGFAVKFYTEEGNWDLVGNNMPVFFIQDAMKFPDLVHSVKPEPHHQMPQASSAHDTFWDFVSLTPESTHMLLWQMSDRAIPRSYRMMQGFGVHTFRFVNAEGRTTLVKFHWTPRLGTHSLVWDEASKVIGADPDFHRRDLWEAIEGGEFPEWELQVQLFTEEDAEQWSFDVLDPTKLVPEELVPLRTVGRLVLNRNPDNFFAETEQIAFCTQHVIPGIDFTNDPLLQGRNFSYHDTQLTRLGGSNFAQIPINLPVAEVHNNQRDGFHQHQIHRGRASYEPNSLAGGCPFQAGAAGFSSFAERLLEASREAGPAKLRAKPAKFAEHYAQAALFFHSQSPIEQQHIIDGFRFELTRVQTEAVRERVVAQLRNVDEGLALAVANGLGMALPEPLPLVVPLPEVEVPRSAGLSLLARPGIGSVATRRVAVLVADGMDTGFAARLYDQLSSAGALPRYVGLRLGKVNGAGGAIPVEVTLEAAPSVLWDAVVLPSGESAAETLAMDDQVAEFVMLQWRHNKAMLVPRSAAAILHVAGIDSGAEVAMESSEGDATAPDTELREPGGDRRIDEPMPGAEFETAPGLLLVPDAALSKAIEPFIVRVAMHRSYERFNGNAMQPPATDVTPDEVQDEELLTAK
jgi:catalase